MEKNNVSPQDESFNLGSASWDEISCQDEIFIFFACNCNLFFILKTMTW